MLPRHFLWTFNKLKKFFNDSQFPRNSYGFKIRTKYPFEVNNLYQEFVVFGGRGQSSRLYYANNNCFISYSFVVHIFSFVRSFNFLKNRNEKNLCKYWESPAVSSELFRDSFDAYLATGKNVVLKIRFHHNVFDVLTYEKE